jgi:hypothetical protein
MSGSSESGVVFTLALHEVMDFLFSLNITGTTNLPDSAFLIRSHLKWD